jgi:hypothetical protein
MRRNVSCLRRGTPSLVVLLRGRGSRSHILKERFSYAEGEERGRNAQGKECEDGLGARGEKGGTVKRARRGVEMSATTSCYWRSDVAREERTHSSAMWVGLKTVKNEERVGQVD